MLCGICFQLPHTLKLFFIFFWPFKLQLFEPLRVYRMCCKSLNYIHRNCWGDATNVRFGKMVVGEDSGSTELSSKVCLKFYVYFTVSSDQKIAIRTYLRHFMCIVSHQKLFSFLSMLCPISNERRSKNSMSIVNSFSQMKADVILLSLIFVLYVNRLKILHDFVTFVSCYSG